MVAASAGAWSVFKLLAWAALFLTTGAHAAARWRVRSRGWQLNRALVALLGALTATAALKVAATWHPHRTPLLAAYAAVYDVSDAAFLMLLMARAPAPPLQLCALRRGCLLHAPSAALRAARRGHAAPPRRPYNPRAPEGRP